MSSLLSPGANWSSNLPKLSDRVPFPLGSTRIWAASSGCPSVASTTLPRTRSWACTTTPHINKHNRNAILFLFKQLLSNQDKSSGFGPTLKFVDQRGVHLDFFAADAIGHPHIDQIVGKGRIPAPGFPGLFFHFFVRITLWALHSHCKWDIDVHGKIVLHKGDTRVDLQHGPRSSKAIVPPDQVLYGHPFVSGAQGRR